MRDFLIAFFSVCVAFIFGTTSGIKLCQLSHGAAVPANTSAETLTMNVSAYCPGPCCCGDFADGITASGHQIKRGDRFVAAPSNYAFGTTMMIPGYGTVPVLDRGGAIKGNKLDLYFDTHAEALQWGRQHLEVTIYGSQEN
jgi:3D (Asp-Asp-Asp) domain-containing protein